ncbi:thiamine phosphate synthase [Paenibacillus aquistagni]|uniref:thiamine phosphate synthase n=1 Tax=Paenibacillus aquistagni TaxID=1852522 RepID=UPI001483A34E|nr:thiamine phosphate synthase [Paenibacillus aquistagni]
MLIPRLHAITPDGLSPSRILSVAESIVDVVDILHLRQKKWTSMQLWELVKEGEARGIPPQKWIVNDRSDVAEAVHAYGTQLTSHSMPADVIRAQYPKQIIGVSVHQPGEALDAERAGAHYVLYGHIYDTASKIGIPARGLQGLAGCADILSHIPIIAIGGIEPMDIPNLLSAGAYGVAVMSSIWLVSDPRTAAKQYHEALSATLDPSKVS